MRTIAERFGLAENAAIWIQVYSFSPAFAAKPGQDSGASEMEHSTMITMDTIFLGAALHGFALVLVQAFNGYENRRANLLLASLVGLLTITMWNVYVHKTGGPPGAYIVDYYLWATPLLWAPVLYLYVRTLTRQAALQARDALHLIPGLCVALVQIPLHLTQSEEWGVQATDVIYKGIVVAIYPQIAVYMILSLRVLRSYRMAARAAFSTLEKINLNWLTALVLVYSVILATDMSLSLPRTFWGAHFDLAYDLVLLSEAAAVFAIGYMSLRQPEILSGQSIPAADSHDKRVAKYLGSPIDNRLGAELAEHLEQKMRQDKLYLQNDLTLAQLALVMGLGTHHMSQVINQHCGTNFYDYVNSHRARYATQVLARHGKVNLTRLAFEAGFNNRASFNKAFRKYNHQTPTEFLAQQASTLNPD